MSAKYVEVGAVVEALEYARICTPAIKDALYAVSHPMNPPDPPGHGRHLDATALQRCLDLKLKDMSSQGTSFQEGYRAAFRDIRNIVRAALDAQKEPS
jgi:hypothetical protein